MKKPMVCALSAVALAVGLGACEQREGAEPGRGTEGAPGREQGREPSREPRMEREEGKPREGLLEPGIRREEAREQQAAPMAKGIGIPMAVERVAQARCDREMRCNNIGAGKKWATKDACVSAMKTDKKNDIEPSECKTGVVEKELAECLQEVKNQDCKNPFEAIGRMAACSTSELCKSP